MATKMMKKTLAILLALTLTFSLTSMVTHAGYKFDFGDFDFGYDDDYKPEDGKNDKEDKDNKGDKHGSGTEYVGITLDNGEVIKVSEGENGDHTYLTNGTYGQASAEIKDDNTIIIKVNTSNGEQTFEGKLSEGYTFDSIDDPTGVNSQSASFDNLIFNINTSKKEPTEPTDPTDPVDPSEPQGPEIIITPVDPTDPVDPVDPVEPADEPDEDYERPERPHYSPKQDEEELPPVEEIVEEEVPLSDVPAEEPVEEPAEEPAEEIVEEIPEEEVPLADVPATGDPMVLYNALSAISGIGLAWLGLKKD